VLVEAGWPATLKARPPPSPAKAVIGAGVASGGGLDDA